MTAARTDRAPYARCSAALVLLWLCLAAGFASAAPTAAHTRGADSAPAAKHFQRGVALYQEADYRAALVEFKRAYTLAPNAAVLYNVGEAEYQLQDYAGALRTFEQYLADSPPTAAHRKEVESSVAVLRTRVGRVTVTTDPPGADVTIDDESEGKTPFDGPLLVSIGHRKFTATLPDRPPVSRLVDVGADDNSTVAIVLPSPTASAPAVSAVPAGGEVSARGASPAVRAAAWILTGMLAAGAITTGIIAVGDASSLKSQRNSYPVTTQTLDQAAKQTTTFSVLADALGAAAIVTGGVSLYLTLSAPKRSHGGADAAREATTVPTMRVGLRPGGVSLVGTF